MIDTVRGVLRVRKWPRKRGTPTSERQLFWIDWFRQANLLAKYADAMSMARAILMTKDTGLYPRDVLLKAMRGRLYTWADETGWRWYPVAAIGDISETLDVLGQTVGDILVRAIDRWRPPTPGNLGEVLTNAGPGNPPGWAPASAGGVTLACLVTNTVAQLIPNSVDTIVSFDTDTYDDAAIHDPAVSPSRFTAPAGVARMALTGQMDFDSAAGAFRQIQVLLNGAASVPATLTRVRPLSGTRTFFQFVTMAIPVVAGDYLEVSVQQTSGAALNLNGTPFMWVTAILDP